MRPSGRVRCQPVRMCFRRVVVAQGVEWWSSDPIRLVFMCPWKRNRGRTFRPGPCPAAATDSRSLDRCRRRGEGSFGGDDQDLNRVRDGSVATDDDDVGLSLCGQGQSGQLDVHAQVVPTVDLGLQLQAIDLDDDFTGFRPEAFSGDIDHRTGFGRGDIGREAGRIDRQHIATGEDRTVVLFEHLVHILVRIDQDVKVAERHGPVFGIPVERVGFEGESNVGRENGSSIDLVDLNTGVRYLGREFSGIGGQEGDVEIFAELAVAVVAEPDAVSRSEFLLGVTRIDKPYGQQLQVAVVDSDRSDVNPGSA